LGARGVGAVRVGVLVLSCAGVATGCGQGTEAKQWWVLSRHHDALRIAFVRGFCLYPDAQTRIRTSREGQAEVITVLGPKSTQPENACSISPACATITEPPGGGHAPLVDGRTGLPPEPTPMYVKTDVDSQCVVSARFPPHTKG